MVQVLECLPKKSEALYHPGVGDVDSRGRLCMCAEGIGRGHTKL